jgi:secreted PhoX family phosphatase
MKRPPFEVILAARLSRRTLLSSAAAGAGLAACARIPTAQAASAPKSFKGIAPQNNDAFVIADGYRYNVVARWGDSLVTGTPDFDTRRMTSTEWLTADAVDAQNRQFGTNCDAVQYFPLVQGRAARGLVCVNHEYFSAELVFPGHRGVGMKPEERKAWMEQHPLATKFMQTAHGVSVLELHREREGWTRESGSRFSRRVTALTPMEIAGPARGHALMRTRADPAGTRVFGTFANCSAGKTPWGTYLTSEENIDDYFSGSRSVHAVTKDSAWIDAMRRFPFRENSFYGWDYQDARFDMRQEPNEPLRFGWMVEIDPHDPDSVPRKRTSLGRFQHEGANTIVGKTGHVAAYMGDDEKFEYIYKFVTRDRFDAKNPAANRDLLDHGTLVRRALRCRRHGRMAAAGAGRERSAQLARRFASQGDVVIKPRAPRTC